jgi:rod shape-determining protein MreC
MKLHSDFAITDLIILWTRRFPAVILLGFILLLMFSHKIIGFNMQLSVRLNDMLMPLIYFPTVILEKISSISQVVEDIAHVYQENTKLKQQNQFLQQENQFAKHANVENIQLRKLLNFVQEKQFIPITARVILSNAGPYMHMVTIDAGQNYHITKGQVVINSTGLVGRVIEVGKRSARVLLMTDINSRVPALTLESREAGLAFGNNSKKMNMLYLPKHNRVQVGEKVVTTGDNEFFPPGLIIGTVVAVDNNNVAIESNMQINNLDYVSVLQ